MNTIKKLEKQIAELQKQLDKEKNANTFQQAKIQHESRAIVRVAKEGLDPLLETMDEKANAWRYDEELRDKIAAVWDACDDLEFYITEQLGDGDEVR